MSKKILNIALAVVVALSAAVTTACAGQQEPAKTTEAVMSEKPAEETKHEHEHEHKADETKATEAAAPVAAPGETGFLEIPIGETIAGPYQVAAVYFQAVDMVPENKQPSAAESDLHLEADIHLTAEASVKYGFGEGEENWPAYLTVAYKVMSEDGSKEITSGVFMPMNASDGPHYGINLKKGILPVGKYKLVLEIKASEDYLLHVDEETGVAGAVEGGKDAASEYYVKQTVEFEWNYDGSQLANK